MLRIKLCEWQHFVSKEWGEIWALQPGVYQVASYDKLFQVILNSKKSFKIGISFCIAARWRGRTYFDERDREREVP